ncbi:Eco57I restriction-modification methylase domain-containing protein [Haliscomenobacter hydrossis]|uniref:site-specific DNA-methyltransferase (adenine-specific) n=1 Tax=Haliscomenobacter hydrossis (strain ATCC 27775 / DSM 1100 / LMG 10767 / O) TaxID=760192 RepID=F4KZS8_HALH1|nr:N-6 DNA methylase [Haliscomenobacter hydrossis]AEE50514.1 N-6 DNA methylase [Haliscomenobacter hydrossis DSM 1100]
MTDKKLSGSFYTPKILADFMVDYISLKFEDLASISVLEPSVGDGVFLKAIYKNEVFSNKIHKIIAVEKDNNELDKISSEMNNENLSVINADFLNFQHGNKEKFSLVIGNPPYIRKKLLDDSQIESCKEIHHNANLSVNQPKNIWTAFLVRCIEFTSDNGILAFVLPSELLQVKYADELRTLILKEFQRVEIFTFNELLFKDCKGQDTLLLIGEKKAKDKGVFYCNIPKLADLFEKKFALTQNAKMKESKWTHHHLDSDEIELLEKLRKELLTINDYCNSKAGIVTAANDYFIVNTEIVEKYSLHKFIKPIIQKGIFVNGSVDLTEEEFNILIDNSKPTYLIALNKDSVVSEDTKIHDYLQIGKDKQIDKRYKTSMRSNWYEVPNIGTIPQAFFFKRCNEYPKLIKNSASVFTTDSAYAVTMRENFKIDNLIYSFYNSLTLAFAELFGRYYGGGVLELTPNEFKKIPIPYLDLSTNKFSAFVEDFKNKKSIKQICLLNDKEILRANGLNLSDNDVLKIYNIREKLFLRRIKTN